MKRYVMLICPNKRYSKFNLEINSNIILFIEMKTKIWKSNRNEEFSCGFTINKKDIQLADAVVFHHRNINISVIPRFRQSKQIWVFYTKVGDNIGINFIRYSFTTRSIFFRRVHPTHQL